MDETKSPWLSRTMWAGVVALIALNAQTFGIVDVSAEDQATITEIIVQVISNGAVVVAMVGRYIAKKRLS